MKGNFFIAVLFFFSSTNSFAQIYHPFPESNASWSQNFFRYMAVVGGHSGMERIGWKYSLEGDTIINSTNYTLVKYQRKFYYAIWDGVVTSAANISDTGFTIGAIREDSSKKIWFIKFVSDTPYNPIPPDYYLLPDSLPANSDILLYDFNLQLGDSIPWAISGSGRKLVGIDSIQLNNGEYRKRFALWFSSGIEFWIEGIGSNWGLFGAYNTPPPYFLDQPFHLSCFKENGELLFDTSFASNEYECDITHLNEAPPPDTSYDSTYTDNFYIFYSFDLKRIIVHFTNKHYMEDEFHIYNVLGQEMLRTKIIAEDFEIKIPNWLPEII